MAIFLETTLLYTYLFHNIGLNILEHVFRKFQVDPFLLNWWKEVLNYAKNHGCHFEVKTTVFIGLKGVLKGVTVSLQLLVKYTNFWLPMADMHLFWQAFFFFFFGGTPPHEQQGAKP